MRYHHQSPRARPSWRCVGAYGVLCCRCRACTYRKRGVPSSAHPDLHFSTYSSHLQSTPMWLWDWCCWDRVTLKAILRTLLLPDICKSYFSVLLHSALRQGRVFKSQTPRFSAYSPIYLNINNTVGVPPPAGTRFLLFLSRDLIFYLYYIFHVYVKIWRRGSMVHWLFKNEFKRMAKLFIELGTKLLFLKFYFLSIKI
jgi:hypothetical protein